jgi:hypothetical protein
MIEQHKTKLTDTPKKVLEIQLGEELYTKVYGGSEK